MEELIDALENRLEHGEDKESLREEVLAAGHTNEEFEAAFTEAVHRYHLSGVGEDSEVSFVDTVVDEYPDIPRSRARGDLHTLRISRLTKDSDLIGYIDLLKAGWQISTESLKQLGGFIGVLLLLVVIVVVGVLALGGYVTSEAFVDSSATLITLLTLAVLGYLFIIVYISVAGFAFLRSLILRQEETSFLTHFGWGWRHIIPIFLLSFYVQIITQAGFVLFVIPGVMAMIYLGYAQYALVHHDVRGFDALIRSFELVYGRFWAIVGRKLFLIAIVFIGIFIEALLVSTQSTIGVFGVFGFVVLLYVVFCSAIALYESVNNAPPVQTFNEHDRTNLKKWLLVVVLAGLLFTAFSFVSVLRTIDTDQKYPEIERIINMTRNHDDGASYKAEQLLHSEVDAAKIKLISSYLEDIPATAALYKDTAGSYAGVCSDETGVNTLLRYAYDAGSNDIFCHDDRDWYIAEAELADSGVFYCVDSVGNNLLQKHSHNANTTCLDE